MEVFISVGLIYGGYINSTYEYIVNWVHNSDSKNI